jgi:cytochrome c551/c552
MRTRITFLLASTLAVVTAIALPRAQHVAPAKVSGPPPAFATSDTCIACHTNLVTPRGENVSFVTAWRPTMMANSALDPYWHAGVRRETLDHPSAKAAIEDECSACHMPMARYLAHHGGGHGEVFTNLPAGVSMAPHAALAADGVSCALCHQIAPDGLGKKETFNARFKVAGAAPGAVPKVFGPYEVDPGRTRLMRSSSGYDPVKAAHLSESDLCGSCHTLYTTSLGPKGEAIAEFPEQMPYVEWRQSAYAKTKNCQACHMPVVDDPTPISAVMGQPRADVRRHTFTGGNFFMQRMLARYGADLGVPSPPDELDAAARRTLDYLGTESATLTVAGTRLADRRLLAEVTVANLAGHKLPTAYPSRRAWLHVTVRDAGGSVLFESGAVQPDGSVAGNDNDEDGARYEPHYAEITRPSQVQIYEAVMGDSRNAVTTGLLTAVAYLKDNRLLPDGFDKATVTKDVAVRGEAATDTDFVAGGDRIRYVVDVANATGPFSVTAELKYQTIGFRWAKNLAGYRAPEPERFVRYYDAMSSISAALLAKATAAVQ